MMGGQGSQAGSGMSDSGKEEENEFLPVVHLVFSQCNRPVGLPDKQEEN